MTTTAVLVCGTGAPRGSVLREGARLVPDLCEHLNVIGMLAPDVDRLVLALCAERYSLSSVQREARRASLDPLGVQIVDVESAGDDPARFELILAGAIARADAFPGSRPEHAKLRFAHEPSRRALLNFSIPEYVAVPAVDASMCAADRGCRACVAMCPRDALTISGGRVVHDHNACEPCGRCVTACPSGAISNPAVAPAAVEAHIRALLDPAVGSPGRRGIVYRCARASAPATAPDWYAVPVPCTGMVPPAWLLAPLLLGAGGVAARPCDDVGCPLDHGDVLRARVTWCQDFLAAAGLDPSLVVTNPDFHERSSPRIGAMPLTGAFEARGMATVALALAARSPVGEVRLAGSSASLGLVEIDATACTGCAACATACPTEALSAVGDGQWRSIIFDPARCVACAVCVDRCPEIEAGAVTLIPVVDSGRIAAGPTALWSGELTMCESCGAPVAPVALLTRIRALVDDEAIVATVARRCSPCRGLGF